MNINSDSQKKINEISEETHSNLSILSLATGYLGVNVLNGCRTALLPFFYETIVFFPMVLYTIVISIYSIWDAFNDPLAGYFSDKNFKFTRKYGKRFPFIIASMIPYTVCSFFLWTPPYQQDDLTIFLWLLIFLCITDGINSIWLINVQALVPNKLRSTKERTNFAGYRSLLTAMGVGIGTVVSSILVGNKEIQIYINTMFIICIFCIFCLFLSIPGSREDKKMIERYFIEENMRVKDDNFFNTMRECLKVKNFRVLIINTIGIALFNSLLMASVPYLSKYVLSGVDADNAGLVLVAPYLLFNIFPMPLYLWLRKKYGHLKLFKYALIVFPIPLIIMFFTSDLFIWVILMSILATCVALINTMYVPVAGDLWDEMAVLMKKRQEGTYQGILTFFNRLNQFVQISIFWLLHDVFTDFDPQLGSNQSSAAIIGIRIHGFLLPALSIAMVAFVFWKIWDLDPDKVKELKIKLKELGI
ncbi:MAG: MFS transporter [archaeon]|nr:MFS transporter [archaeon]